MKKIGAAALMILFVVLLVLGVDRMNRDAKISRARLLRVGNSKSQVEQLLGSPAHKFFPEPEPTLLGVSSETWAYGSLLNLSEPFSKEFPYFAPSRFLRFHFLVPDSDEIAIQFDSSGRIRSVTIP